MCIYIYKLYSIWICIHLWTSSCFFQGEVCNFTAHNLSCGVLFAERNILRSSQRSLRPKSRGHERLHSVPSDTELLTTLGRPSLSWEEKCVPRLWVKHAETVIHGNTKLQRNIFPCETVMMVPRLKTAEVQPSTLAKFVEPFFLVWNSMDANDFVLEHFAENAIHPRKDHWWFGLKQITRYSAHGTTWLRPKTGHTQFMAMAIKKCGNTFAKIHWNRGEKFYIFPTQVSSTRAQRGFDLAANSALGFDPMELKDDSSFRSIVWLSEGPTSHILPGNLLSAERRHRAVTLREVCQRRHSGLAEVPTSN